MKDFKFEPVIYDSKVFIEMTRISSDKTYKSIEKHGKLEYDVKTKLYHGSILNIAFTLEQDLTTDFILHFPKSLESAIEKYDIGNVLINDIIVNNLRDFLIAMKDAKVQALLIFSRNASVKADIAVLNSKAAADSYAEAVFEYSQMIKENENG